MPGKEQNKREYIERFPVNDQLLVAVTFCNAVKDHLNRADKLDTVLAEHCHDIDYFNGHLCWWLELAQGYLNTTHFDHDFSDWLDDFFRDRLARHAAVHLAEKSLTYRELPVDVKLVIEPCLQELAAEQDPEE